MYGQIARAVGVALSRQRIVGGPGRLAGAAQLVQDAIAQNTVHPGPRRSRRFVVVFGIFPYQYKRVANGVLRFVVLRKHLHAQGEHAGRFLAVQGFERILIALGAGLKRRFVIEGWNSHGFSGLSAWWARLLY